MPATAHMLVGIATYMAILFPPLDSGVGVSVGVVVGVGVIESVASIGVGGGRDVVSGLEYGGMKSVAGSGNKDLGRVQVVQERDRVVGILNRVSGSEITADGNDDDCIAPDSLGNELVTEGVGNDVTEENGHPDVRDVVTIDGPGGSVGTGSKWCQVLG